MHATTTASNTITVRILPDGESVMESADPWFRLFRALADLYLAGEIDADTLFGEQTGWSVVHREEPTPGAYTREIACLAARQLLNLIGLAMMEPSCICIANWDGPPCIRGCEPLDRRERLRELIGD